MGIDALFLSVMRYLVPSVLLLVCGIGLTACPPPAPTSYIHRLKTGREATREPGDKLLVTPANSEVYRGATAGYRLVKSVEDWNALWDKATPPAPPQIDWNAKMIISAVSDWQGITAVRISDVIETGTSLHIYVSERLPGSGCPVAGEKEAASNFAIIDRTEKVVHFHIERAEADTCGNAPDARVVCRPVSESEGKPELTVKAGEMVECEAKVDARGYFAVVDQTWVFEEKPKGSTSKFTYIPKTSKVRFPADVLGRYVVKFEVRDDGGRRSEAGAVVSCGPDASAGTLVQLGWGDFDANDDPSTFPRVELEAADKTGSACSLAKPKSAWCSASLSGFQTNLYIKPSEQSVNLRVHYTDERFAGGPAACVRVYQQGKQSAELCDRQVRKAGEVWKVGSMLPSSGTFEGESAPEVKPTEPTKVDTAPKGKPFGPVKAKPPAKKKKTRFAP